MRDKLTAVVFDLDSTIADTRPRHHLSPKYDPSKTWLDYSAACHLDHPIPGAVALVKLLWTQHQVHICSARDDTARQQTKAWLDRHDIWYDFVHLRPADNGHRDAGDAHKIAYVEELRDRGLDVKLFVEDWPPLAKHLAEATGVPVLVVNPCYGESDAFACACQACAFRDAGAEAK